MTQKNVIKSNDPNSLDPSNENMKKLQKLGTGLARSSYKEKTRTL